jgi:hypothetical protein
LVVAERAGRKNKKRKWAVELGGKTSTPNWRETQQTNSNQFVEIMVLIGADQHTHADLKRLRGARLPALAVLVAPNPDAIAASYILTVGADSDSSLPRVSS